MPDRVTSVGLNVLGAILEICCSRDYQMYRNKGGKYMEPLVSVFF